jgi:glycine dehydrogenase subunit 1
LPFIPHTEAELQQMLDTIGADSIEALFDEIPLPLRAGKLTQTPEGASEMQMLQRMAQRAAQDEVGPCFMGAGSYDHHIPAAVWDLTARGEFMTAYTPYQAEASQGTLQLIYEYQSMLTELTGMDVSNASVYDGASGLGEALLMARRAQKKMKSTRVLLAATVHPLYRRAANNIVQHQGLELQTLPVDAAGVLDPKVLAEQDEAPLAIVIQQPNFFGNLEAVDAICDWAAANNVLCIAVVNPLTLAVLQPPGQWGEHGADIVVGDGQPFGIPMASGGPSFGFMCTKQKYVRQMPGRIIGRTEDLEGRTGYTLTLQAREQHIRRGKATSNICTNQGLLVTAATIHMSLMGATGLREVALACCANTRSLVAALSEVDGVMPLHSGGYFHERLLQLPVPAAPVVEALLAHGLVAGLAVADLFAAEELAPGIDLTNALLVCATEKRTAPEIAQYQQALRRVLEK